MIRDIYVMRNGRLVSKSQASPLHAPSAGKRVHAISDTMRPMRHPSNGKIYDSKSRFRAETKARGLVEIGNELPKPRKAIDMPPVGPDIARAIQELGG